MFHLKELSREESLRLVEEAREKAWKDQRAREDDSFNRGMERGVKQGMEQGVKQGMNKGKKELIMSMLEKGMEITLLSRFTGLSEEEIKELQKSFS